MFYPAEIENTEISIRSCLIAPQENTNFFFSELVHSIVVIETKEFFQLDSMKIFLGIACKVAHRKNSHDFESYESNKGKIHKE